MCVCVKIHRVYHPRKGSICVQRALAYSQAVYAENQEVMRSCFYVVLLQAWSAQEAPSPNRGGGAQQEGQTAGQHQPGPDGSSQQEGVAGGAGGQHQPGPVSTSQQAEHQKNQRDLNLKVPILSPRQVV